MSIPNVTIAAFVMIELISDLIGYGEMQVEDAIAAVDGLETELTVVGTGLVVHKTEAMVIIHTWLTLPTATVIDRDVVVLMRGDVNQQRVLAFVVNRIVLQADQDGVVVDMDIVETVARIELASANHIALNDVLLSGVDSEVGGVA